MNKEKENKSKLGIILLILDLFLICGALFVAYGRNPIVYASELDTNEVIYTPSWESSNPFEFTYSNSDYKVSIMPMVNQVTQVNSLGDKTKPILSNNTLNYTSLSCLDSHYQRVGYQDTPNHYEDVVLKQSYNLNYWSPTNANYYGTYFSSRWLYYGQDDYDPLHNSSIFNHIRMNIYSNNPSFTAVDFNGNLPEDIPNEFDFSLYLMILIKNEMLYTDVNGNSYTDTYPNYAFGVNSDGVIKTPINFAEYNGDICDFTYYLKNGLTIDIYFREWLGFSQYNNLVGVLTNFYIDDAPSLTPYIYLSTTLDYVPITFNWDDSEYKNGFNDGVNSVNTQQYYDEGYNKGYSDGVDGFDGSSYYDEGYSAGFSYGHDRGYDDGYIYGYDVGLTESSHDFGFKDLLFVVANTPITLLMNALSFNVFGVNVWAFIMTLLTAVLVVWIVRKMLGSDE